MVYTQWYISTIHVNTTTHTPVVFFFRLDALYACTLLRHISYASRRSRRRFAKHSQILPTSPGSRKPIRYGKADYVYVCVCVCVSCVCLSVPAVTAQRLQYNEN